jgi:hypothetical protein
MFELEARKRASEQLRKCSKLLFFAILVKGAKKASAGTRSDQLL